MYILHMHSWSHFHLLLRQLAPSHCCGLCYGCGCGCCPSADTSSPEHYCFRRNFQSFSDPTIPKKEVCQQALSTSTSVRGMLKAMRRRSEMQRISIKTFWVVNITWIGQINCIFMSCAVFFLPTFPKIINYNIFLFLYYQLSTIKFYLIKIEMMMINDQTKAGMLRKIRL